MDPERFRVKGERLPPDPQPNLPPTTPPSPPKKEATARKSWKRVLPFVALIIVLGLAAGAYFTYKNKPPKHKPQATKSHYVAAATNKPQAPSTPPVATDSHTSTVYNTTFSYPSTWTVVDSGSAPLTATSPVMSLTSANGQTVQGEIQMTLSKQGTLPSAFTTQSVAVLSSQTANYTAPATGQAGDTYISFVQYPSTTTKGGLNGIYLSGNYGYQKDQDIPASNLNQIDPLVYFSFLSCASTTCPASSMQPLTISSNEWSDSSFSSPLLVIIHSFVFD